MKLGSMQEEENSQWVLWTLLLQIFLFVFSRNSPLLWCDVILFFFLGLFPSDLSSVFLFGFDLCRCPICLLEYEGSDVLRQLPACGHIFHTSCVDPWLEKQPTCPVCRVLLLLLQSTKASEESEPSSSEHEHQERSRPSSRASAPQLAASSTPSWVLVNPPLPLPPAAAIPFPPTATAVDSSSSSSSTKASSSSSSLSSSRTHDLEAGHFPQASDLSKDSAPGECPQLRDSKTSANSRTSCHQLETGDGWGSGYFKSRLVSDCGSCKSLQDAARNIMSSNNAASSSSSSSASCNIQIKSRGMKNHSVHSRRWLTESFSFVLSDTFGTEDKNPSSLQEPAATTVDQSSNKSATTTTRNHQSFYYSSHNRQHSDSFRVYESRLNADSQLPLTISPEKCSFEFVPVLTGGCSAMDFSCRWRTNNKQTNKHTTFSCSSLSSGNHATCS